MKKVLMSCLGLSLLCGFVAVNAATTSTQTNNDVWVYIDGQYYQCSMNGNGTTNNNEALGCKSAVESYKTSLKTCMDYYAKNRFVSFAEGCLQPITKDFKANGKKECFFEAKVPCMSLCLENYKNSQFIGYRECDSYCSA